MAHIALQNIEAPEDLGQLSEREQEAIYWQSYHEYLADALTIGDPEEQMEIFRDRQVIESRVDKILNGSLMKSKTA